MGRGRKAEEDLYSYIPEDIYVNILRKLPLNSLLRFRCVSKPWSYQISPYLTKSQKVIVPHNIFGPYLNKSKFTNYLSIDESTQVEQIDVEFKWRIGYRFNGTDKIRTRSFVPYPGGRKISVCGSCNGILLISLGQDFFLWNPSVQSSKRLALLNNIGQPDVSGLCFDSYRHNYKVVLAFTAETENAVLGDSGTKVLVGSSKAKSWKNVNFPFRMNLISHSPGTALHSNLHWQCRDGVLLLDKVMCFDAKVDEFRDFPIPQPHNGQNQILGLGVLDGCLSMCRSVELFCCYVGGTIEVLVMKEYGVKESWTSLFKCEQYLPHTRSLIPLFYTEDRKQVLMQIGGFNKSVIVAYDIEANLLKEIQVLNEKAPRNTFVYKEAFTAHPNCLKKTDISKVWEVIVKE